MSIAYEEEIISYTHKAFIGKDFYSAASFKYKWIRIGLDTEVNNCPS